MHLRLPGTPPLPVRTPSVAQCLHLRLFTITMTVDGHTVCPTHSYLIGLPAENLAYCLGHQIVGLRQPERR